MLLVLYKTWAKGDLNFMQLVLRKGYSSKEMHQNSVSSKHLLGKVDVFRHLSSAFVRRGNVGIFWGFCQCKMLLLKLH